MITEIIDKVIRKNKGIPLEFFGSRQKTILSETNSGKICFSDSSSGGGFGVKAIVSGRVGFSYITDISMVEKAVRQAILNAKYSELKQDDFPQEKVVKQVNWLYDKKVAELLPEPVMDISEKIISSFGDVDGRIVIDRGAVHASSSEYFVINSNGVDYSAKSTCISSECEVALKNSSGSAFTASTYFDNFDIDSMVSRASMFALKGIGRKNVKSAVQTVVLDADVIESIFGHTLYPSLNGDRVQKDKSMLEGKVDSVVGNECLDICDDGRLERGLSSSPFDRDGVASSRTEIISSGVLKNFMYDYVTAAREGKESTGNASGDFNRISSISPTNFIVKPSAKSFDNLVSEVKDGLLIYNVLGAHTANPITGDFSLAIGKGFKIVDGSVAYPVKNAMLVGNVFDLIKNVSSIAGDVRQSGHLVSPSVSFSGQKIVG